MEYFNNQQGRGIMQTNESVQNTNHSEHSNSYIPSSSDQTSTSKQLKSPFSEETEYPDHEQEHDITQVKDSMQKIKHKFADETTQNGNARVREIYPNLEDNLDILSIRRK